MERESLLQRIADLLARSSAEGRDATMRLLELNLPVRLAADRAQLRRSRVDQAIRSSRRIEGIKWLRVETGVPLPDAAEMLEKREMELRAGAAAEPDFEELPASSGTPLDRHSYDHRRDFVAALGRMLLETGVADAASLHEIIDVNLPDRLRTDEDLVLAAVKAGRLIDARRLYRERTGVSKAEAREAVERMRGTAG